MAQLRGRGGGTASGTTDTASIPILADITADGRPIKAIVQVTKQAFAYFFDRVTGSPVRPLKKRPVRSRTTLRALRRSAGYLSLE